MTLVLPKPGQIGFAHTSGIMGKMIRFGEALKGKVGSEWNHAFIVSDEVSDTGEPLIIQATLRGVTGNAPLSSVAPGGKYTILETPGVDLAKTLEFAKSTVGLEYGYFTILAIAIDILSFQWVPAFRGARKDSWICSALAAEALRFGGWLQEWIDVYTITPQQLYDRLSTPSP